MSTLGVVTNPTAGSGRGARWGAQALAALSARGHRVLDLSGGSWESSLDRARAAVGDLDALVVVGGDGMVHLGVQACARTDLPLGIIAAGSGNDVASTLGLPVHDIPAAVRAVERGLDGARTAIDLGCMTGPGVVDPSGRRWFAAVLSAGIDAAIAAAGARMRFPRGPHKYTVATALELPRFRPYGVRLEVDGRQWEQECTLVAVANGPVFGGGLKVSRDSSVTDGMLELVVAEPLSRAGIVRLFPRLYDGSVIDQPPVTVVRARQLRIGPAEAGAPLPAAFADGELVGPAPLDVRVEAAALSVLGVAADSLEA